MLKNIKKIITSIFVSFGLLLTCISPVFAQEDLYAVKVNHNSYETMTEALNVLETSEQEGTHTLTLLKDVVLEAPLILPNKTVILDGSGFTLTSAYTISTYGNLSINNVVLNMEQADIVALNGGMVSISKVSGKVQSIPETTELTETTLSVTPKQVEEKEPETTELEKEPDPIEQKEQPDPKEQEKEEPQEPEVKPDPEEPQEPEEPKQQLENGWKIALKVEDVEYGQTLVPTAEALYGNHTIKFTYSDKLDGEYQEKAPVDVGTWYLKAEILESEEYKGLTDVVEFTIHAKPVTTITVPEIDEKTSIKELEIKDGQNILLLGKDYKIVTQTENDTTIVTITFMGNYTGEIVKTYTVEKEEPKEEPKKEATKEDTKETTTKEIKKKDKEKKDAKKTKSVKTATSTNQVLWITLLGVSLVLIGVMFFAKKKTKKAD